MREECVYQYYSAPDRHRHRVGKADYGERHRLEIEGKGKYRDGAGSKKGSHCGECQEGELPRAERKSARERKCKNFEHVTKCLPHINTLVTLLLGIKG